jgi:hypothetical protein
MNDKSHLKASFIKSGVRIMAGILLIATHNVETFAVWFIVAEVFGIVEELVDDRK